MNFFSFAKNLKENKTGWLERPWLEQIIICLAVAMAYASVWPNSFIYDDKILIVQNAFLRQWGDIPKILTSQNFVGSGQPGMFYRPVPMLLHFFIYQLFGPSTIAFHALNIILQAVNACLLQHFGIRAGFKKGAAFAAALLWAVHPLHTEAVAYMSSTPELLWGTFCLLGLIALLPDFSPRRTMIALIFFILALGSKETAVVCPALAVITLFLVSKERARWVTYLKTGPLWLPAIAYAAVWVIFIHQTGYSVGHVGNMAFTEDYTRNPVNRILTCFATLPFYASLIVWPAGLHIDRNFSVFTTLLVWPSAVGALMVMGGFLQILWGRARRGLAFSFGLLWFAAALFPATGIAFPVDAFLSEHWLYMPLMGLFLGTAQTAAVLFKKKPEATRLLVAVLVFSLGTATYFQNQQWRDTETLFQNVARHGGETSRLRDYLGMFYLEHNEFDKAAEQFQYEVDHDDGSLPSMMAAPHMQLATALLQVPLDKDGNTPFESIVRSLQTSPHTPEAIRELGKALQADPGFWKAHVYLSIIYHYQGNNVMADFHAKQAESLMQKQEAQ